MQNNNLNITSDTRNPHRDPLIDQMRAVTMLLVILIHNIFHLGYFYGEISYVARSYLLVEMPLFFLLSGMSNSLSRKKGLISFYSQRFLRLLIPYWVYGAICFTLNLLLVWRGTIPVSQILINLLKWFLPLDIQPTDLPYLNLSLWFLPIYLGVVVIFPLFRRCCRGSKIMKALPLIILPLSVILIMFLHPEGRYAMKIWNYSSKILFYGFFTYLGCLYQTTGSRSQTNAGFRWKTMAVFTVSLLAMLVNILIFRASPDMQMNKWPPNITYLCFSLAMLCLIKTASGKLMAGIRHLRRIRWINWLFAQYEQYFFTICLYHAFAIYLASILVNQLRAAGIVGSVLPVWLLPFTLILTVTGSAFLGFLFGKIEHLFYKSSAS